MKSLEEVQYLEARKKVRKKKGFYWHLASFMIVGLFFFFINLVDGGEVWFHIPMISWGIGLGFHYVGVFGIPFIGSMDKDWEAKEIEKELARMNAKRRKNNRQPLLEDNHEIDELDLDNKYYFDKQAEKLEDWENFEDRDMKDLRGDFDKRFGA